MEGARTVRGEDGVSVRRDKSAREANIPLWARILSTVRAAQRKYRSIDIPPNAVNGCAQRSAIPSRSFHSIDRSIDRSLLVRVKERRDETRGPRCGGGTICRIVGCPVRALAPHHHRKRRRRRRRAGRGGEGAQKIGR